VSTVSIPIGERERGWFHEYTGEISGHCSPAEAKDGLEDLHSMMG